MFFRRILPALAVSLAGCFALLAPTARAETHGLGQPEGPVLLTISGNIAQTNADDTAVFDIAMLRALEQSTIETETIWTADMHIFSGVRLKTLLDHVGAAGSQMSATAINDYSVTIPMSDATDEGPILAYEIDGKELSRRDKGPLWVIYPFSSSSDYRSEVIYSRSIWQLDRIVITE